jgi:hypothetical protein
MKHISILIICFLIFPLAHGQINSTAKVQIPLLHLSSNKFPIGWNGNNLKYSINNLQRSNQFDLNNYQKRLDILQKLDSLILEVSFEPLGLKEKPIKNEFHYDDNGLLTSYVELVKDTINNNWIHDSKEEWLYNSTGSTDEIHFYQWNVESSGYEVVSKDEFTYTEGYQLHLIENWQWDTLINNWMPVIKEEVELANLSQISYTYLWENESEEWKLYSKREYHYNADYDITLDESFLWNVESGIWDNLGKSNYFYNEAKQMDSIIHSFWEPNQAIWERSDKEDYIYNTLGDLVRQSFYEWNNYDDIWEVYHKNEFEYNNMYDSEKIIVPEIFDHNPIYFNHMLEELSSYEYYYGVWEYSGGIQFDYSEIEVNSISESKAIEIKLFPNPSSSNISIDWKSEYFWLTIEVFNTQGELVLTKDIDQDKIISVRHLNKGIYIYRLFHEQEFLGRGKLVIQ